MFTAYPTFNRYRALKLAKPALRGEDVYALQTMLEFLGATPGAADGILGPATDKAIRAAQRKLGLEDDGAVGPATWASGVDRVARHYRAEFDIATGLGYGQLSHESSLRGGIYSPQRPDGSYDAGVAQRNTNFTPPAEGFNVPRSIEALARNTRAYYDLFAGLPNRRRWTLAAGGWNAPAFACWYARAEGAPKVKASQTARPQKTAAELFAAYLESVSAYLQT